VKERIEEALQCLVGLEFWGAGRITNLLMFEFGPRQLRINRHGKEYEVGTHALHVQCAWHLAHSPRILIGSRDRLYKFPNDDPEINHYDKEVHTWPKDEPSWLDYRLLRFFNQCKENPVFVQTIQADNLGGMIIELSSGYTLSVFPDCSAADNPEDDEEYWRFFELNATDRPHFVVTGHGIEN
jgi:hypothetical protein